MLKSTLLYIKQGLNTHIGAFSPVIIIEDHIYRVLFTHSVKTIRWILITLCAFIVLAFIALAVMQSFYLRWDYNNSEFAVAGTILHGFEFVFVRLAPLAFIASIIGIVITYKKR